MTPFLQNLEEAPNHPAIIGNKRYSNQPVVCAAMVRPLEGRSKISAFGIQYTRCGIVANYMNGKLKR